jgi:iron-sulfur cluster assembly accessory protein
MIRRTVITVARAPLSITNSAWDKMNYIVNQEKGMSFLFSASSGGCNGFNYNLTLLHQNEYQKIIDDAGRIPPILMNQGEVNLIVDPVSDMLLLGTKVDYIHENLSKGIFESKFTFTPDKDKATSCGCGISFSLRTK